jgi:FkbM family methyltransferase
MTDRNRLDPSPALIDALKKWGRQRWIPFGIRDRLLRLFADPERLPSIPFECDFAGLRYRGDLSSYIDWTVNFYGAYEPAVLAFLRDVAAKAGPDVVFVDIGANVGVHAIYMALRVAHVHAFEPWPTVHAALRRNIGINALTNVSLYPYGLSDTNAQIQFHAPTTANLGTGGFVAGFNVNRPAETLPVRRGDDAFADAGITRIDIVKIDTEGYELKTLAGMRGTLTRLRPIVVFEISPATLAEIQSAERLASVLASLTGEGWRIFRLTGMETYRLEDFTWAEGEIVTAVLAPERKVSIMPRSGRW